MRSRIALFLSVSLVATAVLMTVATPATASSRTGVTIAGQVSNASLGLTLSVQAQAHGATAASLSGQGMDNSVAGGKGYCTIPLTGSVAGNVATLSGAVSFSNDPANLGVPVTFTADASTGAITFNFGGFIFTGSGSVNIR